MQRKFRIDNKAKHKSIEYSKLNKCRKNKNKIQENDDTENSIK